MNGRIFAIIKPPFCLFLDNPVKIMRIIKLTFIKLQASFIAILFSFGLKAQQVDTLKDVPSLLLPRFTTGIVKLKSGVVNKGIMNYDLVGQQMIFLQRKQTLVLREPQLVDTIFLANRIFVPFEKGFYELLAQEGNTALFRQHRAHFEIPGAQIGYGLTSKTVAPQYYQQIYGPTGAIDLTVPEGSKVVDDSQYWVRINGEMNNFRNRKQFLKIFPGKQKELEKFISQNKIDFAKIEDVKKLFLYTLSLK